jgi:hypothetical protein
MEGGCAKVLAPATTPADFSPAELPMDRPEWQVGVMMMMMMLMLL